MSAIFVVGLVVAVLAAGVGLMLHGDRKQQRRIAQNGGRRF